jgi:hypothetical protein
LAGVLDQSVGRGQKNGHKNCERYTKDAATKTVCASIPALFATPPTVARCFQALAPSASTRTRLFIPLA